MKNEKIGDGKVCLGVNLPKELHSALSQIAKRNDLSISQVVRQAIRDYIAKETN